MEGQRVLRYLLHKQICQIFIEGGAALGKNAAAPKAGTDEKQQYEKAKDEKQKGVPLPDATDDAATAPHKKTKRVHMSFPISWLIYNMKKQVLLLLKNLPIMKNINEKRGKHRWISMGWEIL